LSKYSKIAILSPKFCAGKSKPLSPPAGGASVRAKGGGAAAGQHRFKPGGCNALYFNNAIYLLQCIAIYYNMLPRELHNPEQV
jgi:hypothetical protein